MSDKITFTVSSGNVFADLGFEDAEEHLEKAHTVAAMMRALERNRWSSDRAATAADINRDILDNVLDGSFHHHSVDELRSMLLRLTGDVAVKDQHLRQ